MTRISEPKSWWIKSTMQSNSTFLTRNWSRWMQIANMTIDGTLLFLSLCLVVCWVVYAVSLEASAGLKHHSDGMGLLIRWSPESASNASRMSKADLIARTSRLNEAQSKYNPCGSLLCTFMQIAKGRSPCPVHQYKTACDPPEISLRWIPASKSFNW